MMITTIPRESRKEELKGKVIRKALVARQILQKGGDHVRIIDVKPDKDDPDHKRSVFIFNDDEKFQEVLAAVINDNKKERDNKIRENDQLRRDFEELKKRFEELSIMTSAVNEKIERE